MKTYLNDSSSEKKESEASLYPKILSGLKSNHTKLQDVIGSS
jgi:hypothetical protein